MWTKIRGRHQDPTCYSLPPPPPGFVPPPAGLPHPKNKDSCPEDFTETKCDSCKPKSGWCTEGPQAGCPCRDKCPAEDSKDAPTCSSESCQGEDGKCTTGHYADCKCKDICPDNEKEFIGCKDDECKSDDDKTCKEGKYKGCKCLVVGNILINQNPKREAAYKHMEELTDVYNNLDKYVPEADAKCSSKDYSDAIAVDKSKLYELGDKFCSSLDQKKKSSKDLKYMDFTFHFEYKP
ncbi:hypothetical protein N7512_009085 [Penicillium capsulatum]|nr:hypothetical protein N7512_009085 [Penicillium capsulatum]